MAEHDFLVKLTHFANTEWPAVRLGHSVGAFDDNYPCANPEGPVDNSKCPDDDPLCNCPECTKHLDPFKKSQLIDFPWYVDMVTGFGAGAGFLNLILGNPDHTLEPTKEQLKESLETIKECDYIKNSSLPDADTWMGCLWKDQNHPSSCDCPCVGENFKNYMEYNRTYSTYWDTEPITPLWRDAQMMLIGSQKSVVILDGDLTLRPGNIINIVNKLPGAGEKSRRFSGRWLVAEINHTIQGMTHKMMVTLVRDSNPIDPETSEELGWFESVISWLF